MPGPDVGDAWIEVHADDSLLPAEVKAATERASRNAKIKVDMVIDRDSITRSLRSVGSVSVSTLGSLTKMTAGVSAAAVGFASLATITAGTLTSIGGLGAGIVAVTAAIGAAVPAAAALGGAFAALGVGAGAAIVGFQGMGEAMKAQAAAQKELQETGEISTATQEKLNAAMANLSPAAREAAKAMGALQPRLEAIRKSVQEKLFDGMADEIKIITDNLLPVFRRSLDDAAVVLNNVGNRFARFTENDENMGRINELMESLNRVFSDLARSMVPFGNALLNIFVAASPVTERFAEAIRSMAVDLSRFFEKANESGELTDFFDAAGDAAALLGSILGNLGSVLGSIFGAGAETGQGLLQTFDKATEKLSEFLNSAEGQDALAGFFGLVSAAGEQFGRVLEAVGPLLSGFFDGLAPLVEVFGQLAQAFLPIAVAISTVAGAFLRQLGPVLAEILEGMTPVVKVLGAEFVGAIQTLTPVVLQLVEAFGPVVALLGTAFADVLDAIIPLIAGLLTAITPLITTVGLAFGYILQALTPLIDTLVAVFVPIIGQLVEALSPLINALVVALVPVFIALFEALIPILPLLADFIVQIIEGLIPILPSLTESLVALVEALAEILLALTPILPDLAEMLALGIQLLPPLIGLAAVILKALVPAIEFIVAVMGPVLDVFKRFQEDLVDMATSVKDNFQTMVDFIDGAVTDIGDFIDDLIQFFKDLPGNILGAIGDLASQIKDAIIPDLSDVDLVPGVDIPGIPWAATGGVVTRPTVLGAGEAGPEAIFPLTPGAPWAPGLEEVFERLVASRGAGSGGGGDFIYSPQFFGPTTSGDRLQELEWTMRYATERQPENVRGG